MSFLLNQQVVWENTELLLQLLNGRRCATLGKYHHSEEQACAESIHTLKWESIYMTNYHLHKKKVFQMELAILFWSRWLHDFSDLAIILIIKREKRLHCCPPLNLPVASDPQLSSSPSPYALLLASHFPPTQPGIVGGLPTGNPGAPQGRISREKVKQWHTRTSPPDSSPI